MRLSNTRKIPLYRFLYNFLMLVLGMGVVFILCDIFKLKILKWEGYLLLSILIFSIVVLLKSNRQIFEYDSDGETLTIHNRSVIPFISKDLKHEFPKYKLIEYKLIDGSLFRTLHLIISSRKRDAVTLRYDISYISKKETQDLQSSLKKILKRNQENQHHNL